MDRKQDSIKTRLVHDWCCYYVKTSRGKKWNIKQISVSQIIVHVWSQYNGANIEQWTIGYGWRQNQEAKLKIVGGVITRLSVSVYDIVYGQFNFTEYI